MPRLHEERFTPRPPLFAKLSGREGVDFLAWHSRVDVDDPDSFQLVASSVVFDDMAIVRLRHSAARLECAEAYLEGIKAGSTLLFVRTGAVTVLQDGTSLDLGAGSTGLLSGHRPFALISTTPVELVQLTLCRDALSMRGLSDYEGEPFRLRSSQLTRSVIALLGSLSPDLPRSGSLEGTTVQGAIRQLLVGVMLASEGDWWDDEPRRSGRTDHAIAFIAANYLNPDLSTTTVARALGVSRRQLQRTLAESGLSVASELRHRRLDKAATLLADDAWEHATLDDVAVASGFGSYGRMRHAFQSVYQTSPARFRETDRPRHSPTFRDHDGVPSIRTDNRKDHLVA